MDQSELPSRRDHRGVVSTSEPHGGSPTGWQDQQDPQQGAEEEEEEEEEEELTQESDDWCLEQIFIYLVHKNVFFSSVLFVVLQLQTSADSSNVWTYLVIEEILILIQKRNSAFTRDIMWLLWTLRSDAASEPK